MPSPAPAAARSARAGRDAAGQDIGDLCCATNHGPNRRTCGRCGKTSPVAVRGKDGRPDICVNCYKIPAATCSICGRHKECSFAATARPVCKSCSPRAAATCARCGRDRPPATRWPEGPVCDPCYTAALRHRGRCASCGQQRRLVTLPGPPADTCTDCGIEDKLYEKAAAPGAVCAAGARELLSAGAGTIAAELTCVFDAVTAAR